MDKSLIKELDGMHQSLCSYVKSKMEGKTWADFDTNEIGDIVDMIKDLSEAKYYEACTQIKMEQCMSDQTNRVEYSLYPEDRELIETSLMRRRSSQDYDPQYSRRDNYLEHSRRDRYERDYQRMPQRYDDYNDHMNRYMDDSRRDTMRSSRYDQDDMMPNQSSMRTTTSSSTE